MENMFYYSFLLIFMNSLIFITHRLHSQFVTVK